MVLEEILLVTMLSKVSLEMISFLILELTLILKVLVMVLL